MATVKKPITAIDNNIIDVFHLISYHRDNPIIMGSNKYKNMRYPSDFDLFEIIHEGKNKEEFIKECINVFQQIIKNIEAEDDLYFIEFKTEDKNNNKIRWKPKHIKNGHMKNKIVLYDVIADAINQLIKIDIVYYHNGLFTEFSNIFNITKNGHDLDKDELLNSITTDMETLAKEGNYFKALKRAFSIAQIQNDKEKLKYIYNVLNSDIGKLGQIKSYLASIVLVLERYKDKETINRVYNSVELLKSMMILPQIPFNDAIFTKFDKITKQKSAAFIIMSTEKLINSINNILQEKAKPYFEKI